MKAIRAKSSLQFQRNASLRKAADALKKDDKVKNEIVSIEWLLEGSKVREVKVGSVVAFRQKVGDVTCSFLAPFAHVSVSV